MLDYPPDYYKRLRNGSRTSAREIVPLVLDWVSPESVVDVGCGTGTWLAVFQEHGVRDVLGVDGDSLDKNLLEISSEQFLQADLTEKVTIDRQFDLAVCLEVAEHLPEQYARSLVDLLTELGPVVLFSAAVPFQGGRHHVNEQWPEYWSQFFNDRGYVIVDGIRKRIWDNEEVEWWYAQNMLIYVQEDQLSRYPILDRERQDTWDSQLTLIHPENYLQAHWPARLKLVEQDLGQIGDGKEPVIFVDGDAFSTDLDLDLQIIPFLEENGDYTGPPPDSDTAIRELERLRREGAGFLAFVWPAFWWLEFYTELAEYLRRHFRLVAEDENLKLYDLHARGQ